MIYFQLPVNQNLPWYTFNITLSAVRYVMEMRFNIRSSRWMLSISDSAGNPILMGIPLLIQRELISQYTTLPLPPGPLFAVDNTGNGTQPTLGSFLTDHMLVYGDPNA